MTARLDGKYILITGAASGIGRASTLKLAGLGANLIYTDINLSSLETLHQELSAISTGEHRSASLDVSDASPVNAYIADVASETPSGKLDGIFHCAGINPTSKPLTETSDDYWSRIVDTNLKGTFNVTRAAIPYLAPGSCILNVSSILGLHPSAGNAVYCAAKYGVVGFSKAMALELGPKGIRVNVLAPGYIDTPTNSAVVLGESAMRESAGQVSMGRMGTADEVADVVGFLMGDGARYMNGSVVEVNGGTG